MAVDDELLHFGVGAAAENVGSVVTGGGACRTDRATAISADPRLRCIRYVAFQCTSRSPKRVHADLENIEDCPIEALRGSPHVVAGCRECVCGEIPYALVSVIRFRGFRAISDMRAA